MPDLNALPHQLNVDDFLELNYLLNPAHQDDVDLQDVEMQDLQALVNPVIQNGLLNEEQAADNQSELTLTISSDPSSVYGSVTGVVNQSAYNQNLHIGMVLIQDQIQHNPLTQMEGSLDAPVQDSFLFSKEGTTAWASFFKPTTVVAQAITVPAQWADFFTAKLLSPEDFDWAKGLMQSKISKILSEFDSQQDNSSRDFVLPLHCPASEPPHCSLSKACSNATQGFSTPQSIKPKLLLAPPASLLLCISERRQELRLCVFQR
jgi:hypothetical protein